MYFDEEDRPALVAPEIIMADLILPTQTNYYRTLFGGDAMSFMDKAAAIAALRFCRLPIVTASSERIDFREPIYEGELIEGFGRVIYVGRSSLVSRVHVYGEDPLKGNRRLCTTGYFSMVAIGNERQRLTLPRLLLEDERSREEWEVGREIHQNIAARLRKERDRSLL